MSQSGLFEEPGERSPPSDAPLAARMRPRIFEEFVGQEHLTAADAAFRRAVEADKLGSVILWGPPGVGKTTLAEIVARATSAHFARVSATSAGVADLRRVVEEARLQRRSGRKTILFIDEIHRFNKAQQDAILPVVEDGTVTLIGATTENPSFEVNSALLSRSRTYVLQALEDEHIRQVVRRAIEDEERGLGGLDVAMEPEAEEALVNLANGDARSALNMLELVVATSSLRGDDPGVARETARITLEDLQSAVQQRTLLYDKSGEMHFDLISALHKSVRGSDPDATIYWLTRMLESGEDPLYLARRLIRMSVEDIGLADPMALQVAMAAQQAVHFLGMPEGGLALVQCAVYLAAAPKSNRLYLAHGEARRDVLENRNDPVPLHLRNAPTSLMKDFGYGEGYRYAHDYEGGIVEQVNLPERLAGRRYYEPSDRGYEARIAQRLAEWRRMLEER
ncbi:MAG TPA: replication-associated recombination protein A [Fimbriimonadaceae bacterium]|nr:replication-associated recombination protein A [Fimbriimonadaceae bacterium]